MLTRSMWFWKSPVSMFFLNGFLKLIQFCSRKHGTLAGQSQVEVTYSVALLQKACRILVCLGFLIT